MTHAYQRIQRFDKGKEILLEETGKGHEVYTESLLMMIAEAQIATAQALVELTSAVDDIARELKD